MKLQNVIGKVMELKNLETAFYGREELKNKVYHGLIIGYDVSDASYLVCAKKNQFKDFIQPNISIDGDLSFATHLLFEDKEVIKGFKKDNFVFWIDNNNLGEELPQPLAGFINLDWNLKHDVKY